MGKPKSVDEYLNEVKGWQKDVVSALRVLVLETAPEVKEVWKWSQPVYEDHGPFAYIKAFKNSVNFGFWRGIDLDDPQGLLEGDGNKMRHVKLAGMQDFHKEAFKDMVRTAVALNRAKGDPTKGS
jgi:hypothetical protein